VIQAVEREFQTVSHSQLVVDFAKIILDHLLGGANPQGNLFVLHPLRDAGDDERLFGRERHFRTRPCRTHALRAIGLHHPPDGAAVEPGFTLSDFAQAFHQHFRLNFARNDAVRAAPEQVERHLLVGLLQHNDQMAGRTLPEKIGNSVRWIRSQGGLEDYDVGGKFLNGGNGLIEALGLADNPYVIFERKDLAQPSAENGLGIRHNHADRAFAVLRLNTFAWLNIDRSADRSAAHHSSFRVLPVASYLRGRTCSIELRKLSALKTVLVNHHTDSTPATIRKTAHHSSATIDLHVGFCAHDIGRKRECKIDSRTYRHIGIHAEQDTVGGNVLGLDCLSNDCRLARGSRLVDCRLQCHRQFDGKARRALHVRITPSVLGDFSNGFLGGFRHVCDDLPSGSYRAPLPVSMCTFQGEITPQHRHCKVTEVMEQRRRSATGTGT